MTEFERKQASIRALLAEKELDGLLLERVSSFAWATCGASSYVNTATSVGSAYLLITASDQYVLADNIESPRLEQEEQLSSQGWKLMAHPWHESSTALGDLTRGLRLGADGPSTGAVDISADLARLRANPDWLETLVYVPVELGPTFEALKPAIERLARSRPLHRELTPEALEAAARPGDLTIIVAGGEIEPVVSLLDEKTLSNWEDRLQPPQPSAAASTTATPHHRRGPPVPLYRLEHWNFCRLVLRPSKRALRKCLTRPQLNAQ